MNRRRLPGFSSSPVRLLAILVSAIFIAEILVMFFFSQLFSSFGWELVLIDSSALVLLLFPFLYLFTFRPLVLLVKERDETAATLQKAQQELEVRVKERTAELERAERRYRHLFEEAPIKYVLTRNKDGVPIIEDCNQQFLRKLGYVREEVLGRSLAEFYTAESREELLEKGGYEQALRGDFVHQERQLVAKDGSVVETLLRAGPEMVADGTVVGTQAIYIAITERKQMERELRRSEEKYRSLFEESKDVVFMSTPEGRAIDINPAGLELFGYSSKEEFLKADIAQDIYQNPEDRLELQRLLLEQGFLKNHELALKDRRGKELVVLETSTLVRDQDGRIVAYRGIFHDVTNQKRREKELRESEERFRTIFEGAAIGIALVDPARRFLKSNSALQHMLGYSAEELRKMVFTDLSRPAEAATRMSLYEELIAGKLSQYHEEKWYIRKDGEKVWGRSTVSLVRDAAGEARYAVGMVEDITEQRRLEAQLRQSQKMEAVGSLAGGIAHDFNNLLTAVIGLSELALKKPGVEDSLRGDLEVIRNAGAEAAELTQQLLAFSRQQVLRLRVLDLNSVVAEFENLLRRTLEEHVEIRTVLDPALGRVKADPGQIHQVLLNLAVNARDAMPTGGRLAIETKNVELEEGYAGELVAVEPGPYVELSVSDSGSGMDEETRSRVFEPFFTTKALGEGTGLGLATVYGIVKQSGGYIWVESQPGEGTTFKVHLSRVDEEPQPKEGADTASEPLGGSETILVVEDNDWVRGFAVRILEEKGYQVLAAQCVKDALAISETQGAVDLLVTDLVLPGGNGVVLAKRIAEAHPETKTLFISGYAPKGILNGGQLEPQMEFLGKPFSASALALKVREILDRGSN